MVVMNHRTLRTVAPVRRSFVFGVALAAAARRFMRSIVIKKIKKSKKTYEKRLTLSRNYGII